MSHRVEEFQPEPLKAVETEQEDPEEVDKEDEEFEKEAENAIQESKDEGVDADGWESLMGKDIRLKYIRKGEGETAAFGAIVTCNYTAYIDDATEPFETQYDQRFKVGEGDAFPGLELPLRHSRVGDKFMIKCASKFAFGPSGRPAIPRTPKTPTVLATSSAPTELPPQEAGFQTDICAVPANADLTLEVEVLKHELEESYPDGSREKTVFILSVRKECGNRCVCGLCRSGICCLCKECVWFADGFRMEISLGLLGVTLKEQTWLVSLLTTDLMASFPLKVTSDIVIL
jgi:FKBP-type peptidyl-prolyl cis-trans isomerase 2